MTHALVERLNAKLRAHEARQLAMLPGTEHGQPPVARERALRMRERGCVLFPSLSVSAVAAFESKYAVTLPSEFREFVTTIGDGGEGPPFYGLLQLGEPADAWLGDNAFQNLQKPFPFEAPWVWEDEPVWTPEKIALKAAAFDLHGTLALGTDGCGIYWLLVITGPERGNIWQLCDQGVQPLAPQRTFLSWYEFWLDGHEDWWADLEK